MRKYMTAIAGGAVCGFLFAGCHDDHGSAPTTPPAPSATAFEPYVVQLMQGSTCDNNTPVQTNNIEFSFSADQDTASPRSVAIDPPTCSPS